MPHLVKTSSYAYVIVGTQAAISIRDNQFLCAETQYIKCSQRHATIWGKKVYEHVTKTLEMYLGRNG